MRSFLVVCVCSSLGIQCEVGMRRVNAVAVVEVAEASYAGESPSVLTLDRLVLLSCGGIV